MERARQGLADGVRARRAGSHRARSFRFNGGAARVVVWHGRADTASLSIQGPEVPTGRTLRRLLAALRAAGYAHVVTNALAPAASLPFVDEGFTVRARLHLLVHELGALAATSGRTRRARRSDRRAILAVDGDAFDDFWRFDATALREATRATPRSHVRVAIDGDSIVAYGIFGLAGASGYVQRLAVASTAQGRGFGTDLLNDGLRWLQTRGARQVFVNTQADNTRAFDIYTKAGFTRLPVGLCVLGRSL